MVATRGKLANVDTMTGGMILQTRDSSLALPFPAECFLYAYQFHKLSNNGYRKIRSCMAYLISFKREVKHGY